MSRADNPHAFSRPEHNLRFTEKKTNNKQTNDRGFSVKLTYTDISSLRFSYFFFIYESKKGENISNVFCFQ